ncbi:MAG: type II secretion system F family protein [Planctomycetota bacterium]|nr:type II secretion system F family protein [Planctomycetota bacterium]
MGQFAYEARDEGGKLLTGMLSAGSLAEAGAALAGRDLFVIRLASADAPVRPARDWGALLGRRRVSRERLAWWMSQLAIMVETGIPLSGALECLAQQKSDDAFGEIVKAIHRQVEEGRPLSDAMRDHPRVFPEYVTSLIRASEASGTMSQMLTRGAEHMLIEMQIIKKVRGAMIYPAMMFFACMAVLVFLLAFILPHFSALFAAKGAALPLPTRMLMAASGALIAHWYWFLIVAVSLVVGGFFAAAMPAGQRGLDTLRVRFPVLKTIFNMMYQTRAFRTIGMLLSSGVPLVDTLRVAVEVSPNVHYREIWESILAKVQLGEHVSGPLLASPLIPAPVAQMIDAADRSGRLPLVFERVAQHLQVEYEMAIKNATQMIEPCLILFLGSTIGFIAAAVMLPLFQASQVAAR